MIKLIKSVPSPEIQDWVGKAARFKEQDETTNTITGIFNGKKYAFTPEMLAEPEDHDALFEFFKTKLHDYTGKIYKKYKYKETYMPGQQWVVFCESNNGQVLSAGSPNINGIAYLILVQMLCAITGEDEEYCDRAATFVLDAIKDKNIPV